MAAPAGSGGLKRRSFDGGCYRHRWSPRRGLHRADALADVPERRRAAWTPRLRVRLKTLAERKRRLAVAPFRHRRWPLAARPSRPRLEPLELVGLGPAGDHPFEQSMSKAKGSTRFSLAVPIRLATVVQCRAPPSKPTNEAFLHPRASSSRPRGQPARPRGDPGRRDQGRAADGFLRPHDRGSTSCTAAGSRGPSGGPTPWRDASFEQAPRGPTRRSGDDGGVSTTTARRTGRRSGRRRAGGRLRRCRPSARGARRAGGGGRNKRACARARQPRRRATNGSAANPGQRPKSDRLTPKVLALVAQRRSYRLKVG
jgi:hypothetical protein